MSTRAGSPTDTIDGLTIRFTLSGGNRRCTEITATSTAITTPTPTTYNSISPKTRPIANEAAAATIAVQPCRVII